MTAIVVALLYWERIALLYVLATFGLTALMIIVALADLGGSKKIVGEPAPADDAAAIGSGISSSVASGAAASTTTTTSSAARASKRR
jgi:hypothetical protein